MTGYRSPAHGSSFLTLAGELGPVDVPWLIEQVSQAMEGEPHDLVIDLRGAYGVSLEALAMLVGARARQRDLHRQLTLVIDIDSPADHALRAAGLQGMFLTVRRAPKC